MKIRIQLALVVVLIAMMPGCGIFVASHHNTLDYKPIHAAAEGGDLATVETLIAQEPDLIEAKDWENLTPLHLAVFHGHKDVVEYLLAHGAEVNAKTTASVTPLHMAAQTGNQDVAELLLAHKAKINAVDSNGWTPLARAEKWHHPEMVDFLKKRGGHE